MSAPHKPPNAPSFTDALGPRLRWAVLASVLINMGIWRTAAAIARRPAHYDLPPVQITRVILPPKPHVIKPPPKKPAVKKPPVRKPRPRPKIVRRPRPVPRLRRVVQHIVRRPPRPVPPRRPPQGAHHKVLTAPGKIALAPHEPTVLAGGNAEVGKPIARENPGNAVVNPPTPAAPKPVPPAPPPPPPPPPAPVKVAQAPPAPAPEPEPAPPPKPRGPTQDAEPTDQVKPEIPDELKQGEYKSFVRVKVEVDADGNATPILRTSSGNPEIDRRVLEALKRWKWKPALRNGEPVASTLLFRFEFEVQ